MFPWYIPHSQNDYDDESGSEGSGCLLQHWYDIFLFPLSILILIIGTPVYIFGLVIYACAMGIDQEIKSHCNSSWQRWFARAGILIVLAGLGYWFIFKPYNPRPTPILQITPTSLAAAQETIPQPTLAQPTGTPIPARTLTILVDDFVPQPYQGQPVYFFNRLDGDRGALNASRLEWGKGQVTTTIAAGQSWGGVWMSLNHPIREGLPVNFSAVLPVQISSAYQARLTGLKVVVERGTPGRAFRIELKNGGDIAWKNEVTLSGDQQVMESDLPPLGEINQLVWVLDRAAAGDSVTLSSISLRAETPLTDPAMAAFVWSYAMLLDNWNPATGLVRDKAKDASGEFDAIQSTGSLAAATADAAQLGVINRADAVQIVKTIGAALLERLPRYHGLWPHWVKTSPEGKFSIVPGTEWSSVDTVIAAIGLLEAQSGLGLETAPTEQMLRGVDWADLLMSKGISHGYDAQGQRIPYAWDSFGGESWLVELAYAASTGQAAPLAHPQPPTANGSGFIDELAWLFVSPPGQPDIWGTDWMAYRLSTSAHQVNFFSTQASQSCLARLGLFGLSAAEVPDPARVPQNSIYQAMGLGGKFASRKDGSDLLGAPVIAPHYSAMAASLRPQEADVMWAWLIQAGYLSPLTNVESLMFPPGASCDAAGGSFNTLKGSWNLALQSLGWGRYLASRGGQVPILWQTTTHNAFLRMGYQRLVPDSSLPSATTSPAPAPSAASVLYQRECEHPDESSVGQSIQRTHASAGWVHGQFGAGGSAPWPGQAGYVRYSGIHLPPLTQVVLKLRYSKFSSSSVPIQIFLDDEPAPRAEFTPLDQGSWDAFTWGDPLALGSLAGGAEHSIKFATNGQQYGVADLDRFTLSTPTLPDAAATPPALASSVPTTTLSILSLQNAPAACPGRSSAAPLGTYVYRQVLDGTIEKTISFKGRLGDLKILNKCPGPGVVACSGLGPRCDSPLLKTTPEKVAFAWGAFPSVRYDSELTYHIFTPLHDYFVGKCQSSEWYMCGIGIVRAHYEDRGTNIMIPYASMSDWELVSFTPQE